MRLLLIGYMYLFIHRPFEIWPALGEFRLELLYALFTGGMWLLWPGKRWLPNPLHRAVLAFVLVLLSAGVVSPWAAQCYEPIYKYFTLLFFYVLLVTVVHEEDGLKRVGQAFLIIMALYMLHSLWEFQHGRLHYRMNVVRLLGVDATMSDPNTFAATLVFALVLVPAFWFASTSWRWRGFLLFYGLLTAGCIALTGSRSGFLLLLLWAGLAILRSRRRLALGGLAVAAAPVLWLALPQGLQNRFETIIHPEVGPLNAQVSADARTEGFWLGVQLLEEHPLTGIGPGAWRPATGRPLEAHNLYGQLMGELGALGALTFAAVILTFWFNLRRIRRVYRDHPEWERGFLYHLGWCLGMALFMLLLNGTFLHTLYRYTWIWFGAFTIIARHCVEQRLAEEADAAYAPALAAPGNGRWDWGGEAA